MPAPEEIVRALYDAFARRDVEAAVALVDPEFEFHPQGTSERASRAGPYLGKDGVRAYFADVAMYWEELILEPGELRVAGNGVVSFGTIEGRSGGEDVNLPVIWVFKLRGGLLLSGRAVATAAEALAAAERP